MENGYWYLITDQIMEIKSLAYLITIPNFEHLFSATFLISDSPQTRPDGLCPLLDSVMMLIHPLITAMVIENHSCTPNNTEVNQGQPLKGILRDVAGPFINIHQSPINLWMLFVCVCDCPVRRKYEVAS
jgi:hypothetical protein